MATTKKCTYCGELKLLSDYHRTVKRDKPYVQPRCKECIRAIKRRDYRRDFDYN